MDRLEAQRFVERRPDPSDGRAQLVVLTPGGRRTLRRFAPEHFRSIARRFADHLSEHEVVVLTNALERVAAAARSSSPLRRLPPPLASVVRWRGLDKAAAPGRDDR